MVDFVNNGQKCQNQRKRKCQSQTKCQSQNGQSQNCQNRHKTMCQSQNGQSQNGQSQNKTMCQSQNGQSQNCQNQHKTTTCHNKCPKCQKCQKRKNKNSLNRHKTYSYSKFRAFQCNLKNYTHHSFLKFCKVYNSTNGDIKVIDKNKFVLKYNSNDSNDYDDSDDSNGSNGSCKRRQIVYYIQLKVKNLRDDKFSIQVVNANNLAFIGKKHKMNNHINWLLLLEHINMIKYKEDITIGFLLSKSTESMSHVKIPYISLKIEKLIF